MTRRMLGMGVVVAAALALALSTVPVAAQAPQAEAVSLSAPVPAPAPDVQAGPMAPAAPAAPGDQAAPADGQGTDPAQLLRPSAAGASLLAPAVKPATAERQMHQPAYYNRRGIPLIIIGGAMFVAGAIVGDTGGEILMVGGVAVAAIGLYQYFE